MREAGLVGAYTRRRRRGTTVQVLRPAGWDGTVVRVYTLQHPNAEAVAEALARLFGGSTPHNRTDGNSYVWMAGTSMAAPHVSGVAALLFGRGWTTPAAIRSRLQSTATDIPPSGRDDYTGWGLVNAAAAVGTESATSRMVAFACAVSGTVRALSPAAAVQPSGAFSIPSVPEGQADACVWQDTNTNRQLDRGDLWDRTSPVTVQAGRITSGVQVTARVYSGPQRQVVR
jgi:serine protease